MKRVARFIGAALMLLIMLFAFASCSKDTKHEDYLYIDYPMTFRF